MLGLSRAHARARGVLHAASPLIRASLRDGDGDTYTVPQVGTVCSGAALPPDYSTVPDGEDCDDTNPTVHVNTALFADTDGDGVGSGSAQTVCIGASAPAGHSLTGTDCDPNDPSKWQLLAFHFGSAPWARCSSWRSRTARATSITLVQKTPRIVSPAPSRDAVGVIPTPPVRFAARGAKK